MARTKTTDHLAVIETSREKVAAAIAAEAATRNAWPMLKEVKSLAEARLKRKAESGQTRLGHFALNLGRPEGGSHGLFGEVLTATAGEPGEGSGPVVATGKVNMAGAEEVFIAVHFDKILPLAIKAIEDRFAAFDGLCIPATEKRKAIEIAVGKVFDAELTEETAIEAAEEAGYTVPRRPDAAPEAVLKISRTAGVPHDWKCSKFDRLMDDADAAHARIEVARDQLQEAHRRLAALEGAKINLDRRYPEDLEAFDADLKVAREQAAYRQQVLADRLADAQPRIAMAARLKDYVTQNRKPKPCRAMSNPHRRPEPTAAPTADKSDNWPQRFDEAE